MPVYTEADPPAETESGAAQTAPWRHEPLVRATVQEHWGLRGQLRLLYTAAGSRTWKLDGHVVKLVRDEPAHVTAGMLASEAIERAGITTGAPVRTMSGQLCAPLPLGKASRMLAVLRRVDGDPLSLHTVAPEVLGELLGTLHRVLRACPADGAWTPDDVLGHMTRGSTAPEVQQMIAQAVEDVGAYYDTVPPIQLLRGDGPEMFSVNGTDISAIIDWGGVRAGSPADDIGCWTAHGATDRTPLPAYTAAFLEGYQRRNHLDAPQIAAIPLFQRLRIVSRACYVTDPSALTSVQGWLRRAFDE